MICMAIKTELVDGLLHTYSDSGFMITDEYGHKCSESWTPKDLPGNFIETDELIPNELTAEQKLEMLLEALKGTLSERDYKAIKSI